MKSFNYLILLICGSLLMTACAKDECTCPVSAPPDQDDPRDIYVGSYIVQDTVFVFNDYTTHSYIMSVDYGDTSEDTLYFNNYGNSGNSFYAIILNGFVSIPLQPSNSGLISVGGNGNIDEDSFALIWHEDVFETHAYGTK